MDWVRVVRDPRALGFEACRQVGERAGIDQLAQSACRGLAKTTNEVNKAQTVGTWAFDEHIVHVVVAAGAFFVVFFPVSADANDFQSVFHQCDHVGQLHTGRIALFVEVFKAWEVQIDQLLEQKHLADVIGGLNSSDFVDCFLDLACISGGRVGLRHHIQVFAGQSALFVLIGVHCDAVCQARALGNDA